MVCLRVSAGSNQVSTASAESIQRCVRPRRRAVSHAAHHRTSDSSGPERIQKVPEDWRSPKSGASLKHRSGSLVNLVDGVVQNQLKVLTKSKPRGRLRVPGQESKIVIRPE